MEVYTIVKFTSESWEKCKKVLAKYEEVKQVNREKARVRNNSDEKKSRRGRKLDSKILFEVIEEHQVSESQSLSQEKPTSSTSNQNV